MYRGDGAGGESIYGEFFDHEEPILHEDPAKAQQQQVCMYCNMLLSLIIKGSLVYVTNRGDSHLTLRFASIVDRHC